MPTYNYHCTNCKTDFEKLQVKIKDRNKFCKESCPECGKKTIERVLISPNMASDRINARKKIPGDMKEVLQKIAEHHPHHNMKI